MSRPGLAHKIPPKSLCLLDADWAQVKEEPQDGRSLARVERGQATDLSTYSGLFHKKRNRTACRLPDSWASTCCLLGLLELIHPTQQTAILYYIILSYFLFNS